MKRLFATFYLGRAAALFCQDKTRNDMLLEQNTSHKQILHKYYFLFED